jgi:hypothetical protein
MKSQFKMVMAISILIIILIFQYKGYGQYSRTGLEANNPKRLDILIEELTKEAYDIGLTTEKLRTKCELRLRQAGIEPIDSLGSSTYLYLNCNIVGAAYNIFLSLNRRVKFEVGDKTYNKDACSTWTSGTTGTHGWNGNNLIGELDNLLDLFLNDYLKANPSVVKK